MGLAELMRDSEMSDVTVIVPAYNAAAWIGETLESIQAQTHRRWELIVADDASQDKTAQVVDKFAACDPRIRYLRMAANTGGPAGPRNAAIAQASTRWVAFCDADDLWHPNKLELQLRVAQETSADLVCSSIRDFTGATSALHTIGNPGPLKTARLRTWQLLGKNIIPNSSALCSRQAIVDAGGFDTSRDLVAVEDYDLWLRLLERGAVMVKIINPLVAYRRLPGSLSARKLTLARRVTNVLRRHFDRVGRPAMFYAAVPLLMTSYVLQAVYLRVWRGRL